MILGQSSGNSSVSLSSSSSSSSSSSNSTSKPVAAASTPITGGRQPASGNVLWPDNPSSSAFYTVSLVAVLGAGVLLQ